VHDPEKWKPAKSTLGARSTPDYTVALHKSLSAKRRDGSSADIGPVLRLSTLPRKADIGDLDFGAATGEQLQNNRAALFQEEVNRGPNCCGVGETTRDVRCDAPNWIVPSKGF
jgi:hypothetical protein